MTFRGHKGTDPFSTKTSRSERFAQMSQQELLIEQKKREIQAKLAQKKEPEIVKPSVPVATVTKPFVPGKRDDSSASQPNRDASRDGRDNVRDKGSRRSQWRE